MSGGYFDYIQYRFEDVVGDIQKLIDTNDSDELNDWGWPIGHHYPLEVIEKFKEAITTVKKAGNMIHRIDWLVSDDDGVETFLKLWEESVDNLT